MIIYKATSPSGRSYVGKTVKTLKERAGKHRRDSRRLSSKFYSAIKKYGFDSFSWEILEKSVSAESLDEREKYYIKLLDSCKEGYNMTEGGTGGDIYNTLSIGQQKQIKEKWKRNRTPWNKGRKWSKEEKRKISKSTKMAMNSAEIREKCASGRRGKTPWNKGLKLKGDL